MWSKRSQKRGLWFKAVGFALLHCVMSAASLLPAPVMHGVAAALLRELRIQQLLHYEILYFLCFFSVFQAVGTEGQEEGSSS